MAGTAVKVTAQWSKLTADAINQLVTNYNKLVADLETLRADYVLHQHAGLNAAPSTNATLAASLTGAKLQNQAGIDY